MIIKIKGIAFKFPVHFAFSDAISGKEEFDEKKKGCCSHWFR